MTIEAAKLTRERTGHARGPSVSYGPIRRSDRLIRARSVAAAVLAAHAQELHDAIVDGVELTSTGLAVVRIGPLGGSPGAVIKIAMTGAAARGLERETAALGALHCDRRLGTWRDGLPRPLVHGSAEGHAYRVDFALAGRPALGHLGDATARPRMLEMAAAAIDVLHRSTSTTVRRNVDELWVDAHVTELVRHARRVPTAALKRLEGELREALAGQAFSAGWIHGDYWLGNVLWEGAGSAPVGRVAIVDWEASDPLQLPVHDLLHLVLYTRRLLTGRELGHIVRDHLLGAEWPAHERVLLDRFGRRPGQGSLSERHCLLLYWLRHVAMHARQQRSPAGYRFRIWERRNVLPVLAAL